MEKKNFGKQNFSGRPTLRSVSIEDLMFLSVETVPELPSFDYLSADMQSIWKEKAQKLGENNISTEEAYLKYAGITAEFGKVAAVAAGVIRQSDKDGAYYLITSVYDGTDESQILSNLSELADNFLQNSKNCLAGHGIRRQDLPFCARRIVVNNLNPSKLQWIGDRCIDTADYWTFGDVNAERQPANLIARIVGVEAENDDYNYMSAAQNFHNNSDTLAERAHRKVITAAQIFLRFRGLQQIDAEHILRKSNDKQKD